MGQRFSVRKRLVRTTPNPIPATEIEDYLHSNECQKVKPCLANLPDVRGSPEKLEQTLTLKPLTKMPLR